MTQLLPRRLVLLAALPALLSACSDLPAEPAFDDVRYSQAGGGKGKPAELAGYIWGGLMSSQRELEGVLRQQLQFATPYVDGQEAGTDAFVVGPLSRVSFEFDAWSQDRSWIRFRAEAEAEFWFRCWPASRDAPQLAYARQPMVFRGTLQPSGDMPTIRGAKDFREWLLSTVYVVFTQYLYIEYDDSCTPTQVFPGGGS